MFMTNVYDVCDKKSSHENLLAKNNSVSIYHKNILELAIEIFKVKHYARKY